jgi:hypothetical protein
MRLDIEISHRTQAKPHRFPHALPRPRPSPPWPSLPDLLASRCTQKIPAPLHLPHLVPSQKVPHPVRLPMTRYIMHGTCLDINARSRK